jgi:hypothetical protein
VEAAAAGTLGAELCTFATVLGFVFSTFFTAQVTNFLTYLQQLFSEHRVALHEAGGLKADVGAVAAQLYAAAHGFGILRQAAHLAFFAG